VWDINNTFSKITTTRTLEFLDSLALFSNNSFIAGDLRGSIDIWSTSSLIFENKTQILDKHNDSVTDLVVLKNGYLVSTSLDRSIKIWNNSFRLWSSTSESHSKGVVALKVKSNGNLISSSQDGTIHFWNTEHFILNNTIYIY
jgi:WD40 repeat protein